MRDTSWPAGGWGARGTWRGAAMWGRRGWGEGGRGGKGKGGRGGEGKGGKAGKVETV